MNSFVKKIFGTGLTLAWVVLSASAQSAAQFGNLPLWFEAGQPAKFTAHGAKSEFIITPTGAEFSLIKDGGETANGQLQFIGANPAARISGDSPLVGKINYLVGNDSSQWQASVPTFSKVRVEAVYPGVDVVYYGNRQNLEYDFNLAAGVNPSVINLNFAGAEKISLNPAGELVVQFHGGKIIQHAPVAYQTLRGQRQEVVVGYKILDRHTAAFTVNDFDRNQPLVIDPVLSYSTYYGGNLGESAWAIAVNNADGSIYVAGQTFSSKVTNNIPFWTSGAYQTNYHGGRQAGDAFVARFDNTGTNLIYATYLGGSGDDAAYAIAIDGSGNAFVAGATVSSNFPVVNPIPGGNKINGVINKNLKIYSTDAFVAELDPTGSSLIYSTYIGGSGAEAANAIALDPSDNAFITGFTYSTNFPVTPDAFQAFFAASNTVYINANAFVAEIAAGGGTLVYSTYLGGTNYDVGRSIAYNNGRVFVAGYTYSTNFPSINCLTNYQLLNGNTSTAKKKNRDPSYPDAFVTAFDASNLAAPLYSTFLGGTNIDAANGIAADASGNAYVVGYTCSTNFPYTTTNVQYLTPAFVHTNDYEKRFARATNGFLTQILWDGVKPSLGYSTMFGGKEVSVANGIVLDPNSGYAYVVGSTTCTNFPVTTNNISGYLSATNNSQKNKRYSDVFVMVFNDDASQLVYSTYLGGRQNDFGNAIAVDQFGDAYVAGQTLSTNFPAVNAYQSRRSGTNDMFIAKISLLPLTNAPAIVPTLFIVPQEISGTTVQAKTAGATPSTPPGLILKWQHSSANYDMETSTDLKSNNWHIVSQSPVYSNGWNQVTLPTTNSIQFFRLRQH